MICEYLSKVTGVSCPKDDTQCMECIKNVMNLGSIRSGCMYNPDSLNTTKIKK